MRVQDSGSCARDRRNTDITRYGTFTLEASFCCIARIALPPAIILFDIDQPGRDRTCRTDPPLPDLFFWVFNLC